MVRFFEMVFAPRWDSFDLLRRDRTRNL